MNKLLSKIYNEVLIYEKETVKNNRAIDDRIASIIEPYKKQLSNEEEDKLKEMLSDIALTAETVGFENGVRMLLKMLGYLGDD